ncbi:programmed cell death protein 2, C terminal [Volvox carteri f. nagariensis]|uniref:Programmed cell death protein 2, C terminal n=1 Tax=Volvox carteri f. nagariensis TaxID=3068 RepID=D8U7F6_VOLCA|nr:programmed cell death protein 2, C terminal [Volvox carteri f. nagariensis]EFJ44292.1 programmed cell death protein 2, C terminal [Volvox carteri f. nagariensis]|eukprot:XP_002954651.1 programmed cell death protein 2, C terminal [Volvox carteri f. nagariensis]
MPSVETTRPAQQVPDDEEEPDEISWNLGFVEEPEKPHLLLRHHFPSKVGGRPAWLDPVRLPTREMLTCRASGKPLDFLLQIYAPVDANPVEGFHRSLFLFISPEGSRLREPGAVRLFRCQLPRHNPYYPSEPPTVKDKYPPRLRPSDADASRERDPWRSLDAERPPGASASSSSSSSSVSAAAAAAAKKRKGGSANAQTAAAELAGAAPLGDGAGGSGSSGSTTAAAAAAAPLPRISIRGPGGLYPELELVVEPEDDYQEGDDEEEALQQYRARVAAEGDLDDEELPPEVVEAVEGAAAPEQTCFADFQARVSWAPRQVIRYCFQRGARPLWPAPHHRPGPGDIPPCCHCGSPRTHEFQVLPQLLHYLHLDEEDPASPDWSTLVAFTCAASCSPAAGAECSYLEELVWVQPPAL